MTPYKFVSTLLLSMCLVFTAQAGASDTKIIYLDKNPIPLKSAPAQMLALLKIGHDRAVINALYDYPGLFDLTPFLPLLERYATARNEFYALNKKLRLPAWKRSYSSQEWSEGETMFLQEIAIATLQRNKPGSMDELLKTFAASESPAYRYMASQIPDLLQGIVRGVQPAKKYNFETMPPEELQAMLKTFPKYTPYTLEIGAVLFSRYSSEKLGTDVRMNIIKILKENNYPGIDEMILKISKNSDEGAGFIKVVNERVDIDKAKQEDGKEPEVLKFLKHPFQNVVIEPDRIILTTKPYGIRFLMKREWYEVVTQYNTQITIPANSLTVFHETHSAFEVILLPLDGGQMLLIVSYSEGMPGQEKRRYVGAIWRNDIVKELSEDQAKDAMERYKQGKFDEDDPSRGFK